jgi:hypothetical protein
MNGLGTQVHSRTVLVDSYPWFRGDTVVELLEKWCLWLGGTSLVCSQLVSSFIKISALCHDIPTYV